MNSGTDIAGWSGRIRLRATRRTFAQHCFGPGSACCSISHWSSAWSDCDPNGGNYRWTRLTKSSVPGPRLSASSPTLRRDLPLLPPATEKVWAFLKEQSALSGFILAGGSALALLLRHRMSEDLDFVYPAPRLPRQRLDALLRRAEEAGFTFRAADNEAALLDFAESALDLRDYQQDFLVNNSVKVSFFAPDESLRKILLPGDESKTRVATLPELFKAKSLVSARRSKTRDWLDLYLLMKDHGFSIFDYRATFDEAGSPTQCDTGLARLCSGVPQRDDEGYAYLLPNPPSLEEMKSFFVAQRAKLEIESAAEAKRRKDSPPF
jgi:hypothetical protein